MIKNILYSLLIILLTAYAITMMIVLPQESTPSALCEEMIITINTHESEQIFTPEEITAKVARSSANPIGKEWKEVDLKALEKTMEDYSIYTTIMAFKTNNDKIHLVLTQREPICHIIGSHGSFYLDSDGKAFESSSPFGKHIAIATGEITKEYATESLLPLIELIRNDSFWNRQIQQINVLKNGDIELSPTVGEHRIILGKPKDLDEKFDQLKRFYFDGLAEIGWNRHSIINIKYRDQIVCTKR